MTKKEFSKLSQSEKIVFLKRNIGEFGKFLNLCDFSYTEWEEILSDIPVCVLKDPPLSSNTVLKAACLAITGEINETDAKDLTFSDWEFLFARRPEFEDAAFSYPSGSVVALLKNPSNANEFKNWILFDVADWDFLLKGNPSFEKFAKLYPRGRVCLNNKNFGADGIILPEDSKIYDWNALKLLSPHVAAKYADWSEIGLPDWIQVLERYPEFSTRFDKWNELNYDKWLQLVSAFEVNDFFEKLAKNYPAGWAGILCLKPELVSECNMLNEITVEDWLGILRFKPSLIEFCDKYREFSREELTKLFKHYENALNTGIETLNEWAEDI